MVTALELMNQARYGNRSRGSGVTFMPPVRIQPPRPAPVEPRGSDEDPRNTASRWLTPDLQGIANYQPPAPATNQGGGGGLQGLGWLIGKPLQAGLSALSVLDYPRAAVVAGQRELLDVLNVAEAGKDTGWDWDDLMRNIKEHKGFGELIVQPALGDDSNIWLRRGLGLAGDVAFDPFSYLTAGTKGLIGAPARAEYANKLLDAQQAVAKGIARNEDIVARMAPTLGGAPPATGYGALAQQVMGDTLAGAQRELPEMLARQEQLLARPSLSNQLDAIEQIGRRGVNVANPTQLEAMGIPQHAVRWFGKELPGTERISRGVSRAMGPVKERITASTPATKLRSLRTPTGEAGQELGRAMERILTGEGGISMERALRTIKLDQWIREGGSTFRAFAARALQQLDDSVAGMSGEERAAMLRAAEAGEDNIVRQMAPRMVEAAREAGVELPVIEGMEYVPHVLSREAFNFLDKMRSGKNPLVDAFRRKIGITSDDLLEEGGFLQRRSFRPDPETGEPVKFKIGDQEITITTGTIDELEEKLGGVLREAGFEGKLYETDPVEAWKRYIISTERDVGKRYSARRGQRAGFEGLFVDDATGAPSTYDPVAMQDILPTGPGGPTRKMAVENPQAEPKDSDLFEYVEDEAATAQRNKEIAQKKPSAKKAQGRTQREIAEELETLGQAERENIAARIDATAQAAWNPHRDQMKALKDEMTAAREQVAQAEQMGGQYRAQLDQIDDAIAEADREITSLQSRIGGITRQARRKVEVQSEMMLDTLKRELDTAQAERARLMTLYEDAISRAGRQLPAAQRRAATREWLTPMRHERDLRKALAKAKRLEKADRIWAENYLRGAALDPKTGKSRWITAERYKSAQARLDDPKVQRQYNALIEERQNLIDRRLRLLDEASDFDRRADDATAAANRLTDDVEEERMLRLALEHRRAANSRKAEAAKMLDTINEAQRRIQRHPYTRDTDTLRLWNKQQRDIDRFNQDIGLGQRIDIPKRRKEIQDNRLALEDFLRQKMHEEQFRAQPPPATLTEHYERELPKAAAIVDSPEARTLRENRKRLREVKTELDNNPEPTMRDVELPDAELIKRGGGSYEMKVGEGELDRYSVEHIVIPASEAPAGYGRVDYWAISYPGERVPDVAATSLREAREKITNHRQLQALGEAKRTWQERTRSLHDEQTQLTDWLQTNEKFGERVAQAERTSTAAAEHTARQAEIEQARRELDQHGDALSKLNAKTDLEAKLNEPEPTWEPGVEKRAEFDARHQTWADGRESARKQLNKVNRQLRAMGDAVSRAQSAQRKLNQLEAAATREFENVPKIERPPFFAALEAENAAKVASAGDLASQLEDVARKWEPPAAEAVARERMAAAQLGRAGAGMAEETAEGVPTTTEGLAMQVARGTEEVEGAMPAIAHARQRIEEIHAGKTMNEADRPIVEEAQAAWFAPYNEGIENHRVARARYAEIETRAAGLKRPLSAVEKTQAKRGGRPYGTQLKLIEGAGPTKARAAGNLAANVGTPAYEAQPIYATIDQINKIIAANPTGDDALMLRIEAEVGSHLTHLDNLTRQYDIPARALNQIIRKANNGTLAPVLKRQLKEGFQYLWEGGDIIIDKELKRIYFNASKGLDSKLFGRTFTMLTDFFKTYATLTPGFHVRNALSAIFMNSSEGVGMATQRDGVRLWRQFVEAKDPVAWMRELRQTDAAAADAFRATFASGAGGQFMERGVSELRAGGARVSERLFANKLTRMSQRFGADWVEGPVRLALALDSTRAGMTVTDAINRVTRVHFDYGQVSRFDERAKRIIPFWTFMSRNLPLQFTQMWAKPRTYLHYQSFVRNMTMGVEEDPLIPEYIKQGGGFDTGIRTPDWMSKIPLLGPPGGMPVVLQPDLPHVRLQEDVRRTAAALGGDNPGQILSDVNPYFTAPFEYAMGKDFFTGKEYGPEDWSQTSGIGTPLAMLASPFGGGKRGAGGEWYMQDKMMNLLRSLVPPIDRTARLTPGLVEAEPEGADRMLESYIRFLGGPVRTISEDQKRSEAARRYYDALDLAKQRAATGG